MKRRAPKSADPAKPAEPESPRARFATVLPIAAAQAFALWAALNDSLDYYDYQLLVAAELLLVQLSIDGGACFAAEYQPGAFTKNQTGLFKGKGGAPAP